MDDYLVMLGACLVFLVVGFVMGRCTVDRPISLPSIIPSKPFEPESGEDEFDQAAPKYGRERGVPTT